MADEREGWWKLRRHNEVGLHAYQLKIFFPLEMQVGVGSAGNAGAVIKNSHHLLSTDSMRAVLHALSHLVLMATPRLVLSGSPFYRQGN